MRSDDVSIADVLDLSGLCAALVMARHGFTGFTTDAFTDEHGVVSAAICFGEGFTLSHWIDAKGSHASLLAPDALEIVTRGGFLA